MAQKAQEKGVTGPAPVVDEPGRVRNVVLVGHSGRGQDDARRGAAGRDRHDQPGRLGDRGHHGQRPRPGRGQAAAVGQPRLRAARARRHQGQPARHPRLRRLRRRAARRAARRRRGPVRRLRRRRHGRGHRRALGGVRRASACRARSRSPGSTTSAPTSTRPSPLCQRVFGDNVLPLYLPMLGDDGAVDRRPDGPDHPAGLRLLRRATRPRCATPTPSTCRRSTRPATSCIEGIIAESEDETLMERYLERRGDRDLGRSSTTWRRRSPAATSTRSIPVCAETGVGLDALLEVLTSAFPSPLEHDLPAVTGVDGSPRRAADLRPATARWSPRWSRPRSTRTSAGSRLVRVFSGTLRPESVGPRLRPRHGASAATPTTTPTSASRTSTRRWAPRCARCRTASPATSARSPSRAPPRPATRSPPRTTRC